MYICLATHLILVCGALQFENVIGHLVIHAAWHHQLHREPEGKCCMAGFRFFLFWIKGCKCMNVPNMFNFWGPEICIFCKFSDSTAIQKKKKIKKSEYIYKRMVNKLKVIFFCLLNCSFLREDVLSWTNYSIEREYRRLKKKKKIIPIEPLENSRPYSPHPSTVDVSRAPTQKEKKNTVNPPLYISVYRSCKPYNGGLLSNCFFMGVACECCLYAFLHHVCAK